MLAMMIVAAIFYIHGRLNAPDQASVNGTYFSQKCGNIVLRDGQVYYKGTQLPYDLENMKFGLMAWVKGQFTENGIIPNQPKPFFALDRFQEETDVAFITTAGVRGIELLISGHDCVFLKKS